MEIGIILNPKSRANIRNPMRIKDYQKLGKGIIEVRGTASLSDLARTARDFKKRNVPYLGISGGDGTIHQVITAFINAYHPDPIPPVLLLGDGTMNNIAHSLGIRGGGKNVLNRFLLSLERRRICMEWRDTMQIEDRYCFLFGCGLTSNFLLEVYRDGKKGYLKNIDVIRQ
ncbi:MAG TPA: diacylglycerol kinase family protein, partial [Spirochaetota bacterium]